MLACARAHVLLALPSQAPLCGLPTRTLHYTAQAVFAMTPSSAMVERMFSLMKVMFGEDRDSSLGDLMEASVMSRYNS